VSITPTEEGTEQAVTVSGLLSRAARGAVALGARQVVVTGMNVVGAAALARLVEPAVFGVYAVAAFVVGFLNFFAEAGLGASLIRQPKQPSSRELQSAFTLQATFAIVVVAIGWTLAPMVADAVDAVSGTTTLIRLGLLSLLVSPFHLVPASLLERELQFARLGAINVAQALVFNGIAVGMAVAGDAVLGVGVAMLAQAALGAALLAVVLPWRPGVALRDVAIRSRLAFSVPLQASSVLSSLKDAIAPLFVGGLLGARSVGLVEWANSFAAYPVIALMAFQQVYLPTFSKLQHDPKALGKVADSVLLGTNLIVAPIAALTFALAEPITVAVFGEKWLAALPTFRLFWIANLFVASASPLFSLLYARGRTMTALKFTVIWMATTWVLGVPLIKLLGIEGYALANVGVQLTNLLLFRAAGREAPVHVFRQFWRPWLVAAVIAGAAYTISEIGPASTAAVAIEFTLGLLGYVLMMWRVETQTFRRVYAAMRERA
jgi:O-antigen/teichoic acid export membrane protein